MKHLKTFEFNNVNNSVDDPIVGDYVLINMDFDIDILPRHEKYINSHLGILISRTSGNNPLFYIKYDSSFAYNFTKKEIVWFGADKLEGDVRLETKKFNL
jgi:hypothetical protein